MEMTDLEQYKSTHIWHERVRIIALFHYERIAFSTTWSIAQTAAYFSISNSTVAEDLQIAPKLNELKDIGSRNKALMRIRGLKIP